MILLDRACLQHFVDVLEGRKKVSSQASTAMIKQMKRLIQVDKDKESGKLCGRPKKKGILDFNL